MTPLRWAPALFLILTGTTVVQAASTLTGKQVFDRHCVHCHAPGNEHPGTRQLAMTRGQDRAILEQRDDLSAEYVRQVVRQGLMSMPPFVPSDLTDERLKVLIDYLSE